MLPIEIIFEDNDLFVINKPAGLVVNRAETVKGGTVQDWVQEWRKRGGDVILNDEKTDFYQRNGIIHRLDKDTSGLLIIAKNTKAFSELQRQFKEREIEKRYLALVHGDVKSEIGKIEAPVTRNPFNRKKFGVFLGGRPSVTEYRVLNRFEVKGLKDKEIVNLVDVCPKTGRTHQIRVHFKYINHPLVSDEIYTGRKQLKKDLQWCPRLFLHAYYLKFKQPKTGKELVLKIDLPDDLNRVLKTLEGKMEEKGNRGIEI